MPLDKPVLHDAECNVCKKLQDKMHDLERQIRIVSSDLVQSENQVYELRKSLHTCKLYMRKP